jgi:hypothetical protein
MDVHFDTTPKSVAIAHSFHVKSGRIPGSCIAGAEMDEKIEQLNISRFMN